MPKNIRLHDVVTKSGDGGTSEMPGYARRISKDSIIFECVGSIDEANAALGNAREILKEYLTSDHWNSKLDDIQNNLFHLGADIIKMTTRIDESHIQMLETDIDNINKLLPPLESFVIPQGRSSSVHVARTSVRRAERKYWKLVNARSLVPDIVLVGYSGTYLNRLSDFLFVFGRYIHRLASPEEKIWT